MKWLIGLIILAQAPFLFIAFVAAGTDGKASSLAKVWAVVIPIALSGGYALFRHFSSRPPTTVDWIITAVACAPVILLLVMLFRKILFGS
jgi:hypothetical protein